jgi:hypothetical protein
VIPVSTARLSMGGRCGFCAVFKDRGEAITPARERHLWTRYLHRDYACHGRTPVSQNSTACRRVECRSPPRSRVGRERDRRATHRSGSVDMLGPACSVTAQSGRTRKSCRSSGRLDRGTVCAP